MNKTPAWVLRITLSGAAIATTSMAIAAANVGTREPARAAIEPPPCVSSGLRAQLYDAGLIGAGNAGTVLTVTNVGTTTCELTGYVVPELIDPGHPGVPTDARTGSTYFNQDPGPQPVDLTPGERASCVLAWHNGAGPGSSRPTSLRIWPPDADPDGEDAYLTMPFRPGSVGAARLTVSALAAHTPLSR